MGIKQQNSRMDIWEIRRQRMRELARRAGSVTALAKKLGMAPQLLHQYIGKTPTKRLGDKPIKTAAKEFKLDVSWFDRIPDEKGSKRRGLPQGDWPFSFTLERFQALPEVLQKHIDGRALGAIEAWELVNGPESHRTGYGTLRRHRLSVSLAGKHSSRPRTVVKPLRPRIESNKKMNDTKKKSDGPQPDENKSEPGHHERSERRRWEDSDPGRHHEESVDREQPRTPKQRPPTPPDDSKKTE